MRILFSVVLLLSSIAFAKDINVNITNLVKDDEGIKIIASNSQNKMVIYYLSQNNEDFAIINQKLQAAQLKKAAITLDIETEGLMSVIDDVKEIKK